jgi:hypothetical protein
MTSADAHHEAVMSGHGFYNKHSTVQATAAEFGLGALRAAAEVVPIPVPPQPLIVADYGCSQGQNSLRPIGEAVTALRARTSDPITVVHTDLPGNDFTAVFEALANDPNSYVVVDDDAYALAAGRSFYDEILPPGGVALGWSATTTHWLSEVPCPVPGHLQAHLTDDAEIRGRFADRAAADWEHFLAARAAELAPGARLVMVEPCAHPDGRIGSENIMGLLDQVIGEFVADGRISADDAAAATMPVWMRTPDEYGSPVTAHPGLDLVSAEVFEELKSPLWAAYEADGDDDAYVEASVGAMRAWSGAMLAEGITDPADLDAFYERCRALGAADPERLHIHVFHIVLDIARR